MSDTHLPPQILNVALTRTNLQGLLLCSLEIFLLANIGHEGDNFISFVLEAYQHVPKTVHRHQMEVN
jgi:hypothetical protein